MYVKNVSIAFALIVTSFGFAQGGREISPENPIENRKWADVKMLLSQGDSLARSGRIDAAISEYKKADKIEKTTFGFKRTSQYRIAKLLSENHRDPEGIQAFRQVFRWNEETKSLDVGIHPVVASIDYSCLLARVGEIAKAKAMYYFALRQFNPHGEREMEPVPFLIVFDPDPEAVVWDFSPENLNSAVLLLGRSSRNDEDVDRWFDRSRQLRPDWFLPLAWKAAAGWNQEWSSGMMAQAKSLAQPGLETELMATCRREIDELKARNKASGFPDAWDNTPMMEGVNRRKKMKCLIPDEALLKSLCAEQN